MLTELLKEIRKEEYRIYKFRYLKGFIGFIIGVYFYYLNKRYKESYKPMEYISYFVVRSITGNKQL